MMGAKQKPMQTRTHILLFLLFAFFMAALPAHAQETSAPKKKDYQRVMFNFGEPSHLSISNNGTALVLKFDHPVTESIDAIKAKLNGYATNAQLSADGKTVNLTMNKAYRVRQFVSGSSVGIDVVGQGEPVADAPAPEAEKKPTADEEALSTKKSEPVKPVKEKKQPKLVEKKPTPPAKKADDAILSTKKSEPLEAAPVATPKAAEVKKTSAPAANEERTIYTTKPNLPVAAPASVADTDVPESAPPAKSELLTTKKPEPAKPAIPATAEKKPLQAPPIASKPPEKAEAPKIVAPKGPFIVGAHSTNNGTEINFPWQERTAAAVFERAHDIWIIFSRPSNTNLKLLRSVLPASVLTINQYAYAGNTVLRLTTDGSLHANASQPNNGYGWNVLLSSAKNPATLEVTVGADGEAANRHLVLSAFDVAPVLHFYDPRVGDWLLIIPTYEAGRGVVFEKRFPEITFFASNQGIAATSVREDLKTENTRIGLTLSVPEGLRISENLPMQTEGTSAAVTTAGLGNSGVLLPYRLWYVSPDQFHIIETQRLHAATVATRDFRPEALMSLVTLYLGQGMGSEAHGYLSLIEINYPEFFKARKLALLDAAAYFLMNLPNDAANRLTAPELNDVAETALWREAMQLYIPKASIVQQQMGQVESEIDAKKNAANIAAENKVATGVAAASVAPAPVVIDREVFHFLKYNKSYIQFYPPIIRQRLAILAADAYMGNEQEEKALATFDTLNKDGILKPIQPYAEFALGAVAAKKKKIEEALHVFDGLAANKQDRYIAARAHYAATKLRYAQGSITAEQAADAIESTRSAWRGDALEHEMLLSLANIYKDLKRYDDTLRSWRTLLDVFPTDPDYLAISGNMSSLFEELYLHGLADDMPPLKALSLFYEFRDITPLGDKGDEVIQHLADRLAKFDLLDRATQLLDHQIKFRVGGEQRSRIGARLALLYLLNQQPKEALAALEATNYGENNPELKIQRQQLSADALSRLGRHEEALTMLFNDTTKSGILLRLDILWAMQDWPNVVNRAEDIMAARPNLTAPLTQAETEVLLKLALAYNFQSDYTQLRYLRDYYSNLIPDTAYKQVFDYITNDTSPLDPEDFAMVSKQISHAETFLDTFRTKIANGKLSDAIK